jgi:hypothetical protein
MPGIGHLGVGLAAKRIAPNVPLGALLVAAEATDLLWGALALTGIESVERSPWSHSLVTSAGLSALAALLAGRIYRDPRTGAAVGLVVLSHWALDFVVWKDTLPLLFEGSPKVGLGLYGSGGTQAVKPSLPVLAIELGLPLLGLAVYLQTRGVFGRRPASRREANP